MSKKKAILCTVLYAIVLVVALTVAFFIKSDVTGISLYQLVMNVIANAWIGCSVDKFYRWLLKE
jgi:zinc transporter ZupT